MRPIALLLMLALIACRATGPDETSSSPPHIVVILADDMGWGDPGCFNAESRIPTPHIDALARDGMRFNDAHAPGSVCVPSRYGLLTGRYPVRRGRMRPGQEAVIRAGRPTLASVLGERGYHTAMVGKWHLGFDDAGDPDFSKPLRGGPLDRGFETWFGIPASLDIPPYYYVRGRNVVAPPTEHVEANGTEGWTRIQGAFWRDGGIAPGFEHAEVLPRFRDEAVQVITDHGASSGNRPLFLYVALPAPHTPWLPHEPFEGVSDAGLYGDFAAEVDAVVGDIVAALDDAGMAEDTLVVFTSDNGPVWYPQDVERFDHSSTGSWRGMKGDAWEGGHRMPFVVRWPGHVAPASTSDQTICFTDLLATCAEAAGQEVPADAADSISFLPILEGQEPDLRRKVMLLKSNATVVREGDWKLIRHLGSGGFSRPRRVEPEPDGPSGQLYDLAQDPGETQNLWQQHPEVVARLEQHAEVTGPAPAPAAVARQSGGRAAAEPGPHDERPPLQVFIMLGQSNMVGFGRIEPEDTAGSLAYLCRKQDRYPHLLDEDGEWRTRDDVWCVKTTVGQRQGWLQPGFGARGAFFGPELQFGHVMGDLHDEPVLVIKASQGNRSLGWDILPPGSERFEFDGRIYAGYGDKTPSWVEGEPKEPVNWYAGKQYDDFVADIHAVLDDLERFFPEYDGRDHEVAGFAWWQGHKDQNAAHASRYEQNLVRLIDSLREEFDAPQAPFAIATIAFGGEDLKGHGRTVAEAQLAVSGETGNHPRFAGNVKTVDVRRFWRDATVSPSRQGYHYNHNAETFLEVGNALGEAMAEMLREQPETAGEPEGRKR